MQPARLMHAAAHPSILKSLLEPHCRQQGKTGKRNTAWGLCPLITILFSCMCEVKLARHHNSITIPQHVLTWLDSTTSWIFLLDWSVYRPSKIKLALTSGTCFHLPVKSITTLLERDHFCLYSSFFSKGLQDQLPVKQMAFQGCK